MNVTKQQIAETVARAVALRDSIPVAASDLTLSSERIDAVAAVELAKVAAPTPDPVREAAQAAVRTATTEHTAAHAAYLAAKRALEAAVAKRRDARLTLARLPQPAAGSEVLRAARLRYAAANDAIAEFNRTKGVRKSLKAEAVAIIKALSEVSQRVYLGKVVSGDELDPLVARLESVEATTKELKAGAVAGRGPTGGEGGGN